MSVSDGLGESYWKVTRIGPGAGRLAPGVKTLWGGRCVGSALFPTSAAGAD